MYVQSEQQQQQQQQHGHAQLLHPRPVVTAASKQLASSSAHNYTIVLKHSLPFSPYLSLSHRGLGLGLVSSLAVMVLGDSTAVKRTQQCVSKHARSTADNFLLHHVSHHGLGLGLVGSLASTVLGYPSKYASHQSSSTTMCP
jgi:hypothetical protein